MANNYLLFSEVIPNLTSKEEEWLRHQLEIVEVYDGHAYPAGNGPSDASEPEFCGCRAYRDMADYDADWGDDAGFEYTFKDDDRGEWGRHVWLRGEDCGQIARVVHVARKFLKQFRRQDWWAITWAATCDKPRVGHFGGGAAFVTAEDVAWLETHDFVADHREQFLRRRPRRLPDPAQVTELLKLANDRRVPEDELEELVHSCASQEASGVNNDGLEEQIQYLLSRWGYQDVRDALVSHESEG